MSLGTAKLERIASCPEHLATENAGLVKTNATLRTELTSAQATIARLESRVTGLVTLDDNLRKQLADLKSRLDTNSQNSSKPPSSDVPGVTGRGGRGKPTGRRRGGQPGHERGQRPLVPGEGVGSFIDVGL